MRRSTVGINRIKKSHKHEQRDRSLIHQQLPTNLCRITITKFSCNQSQINKYPLPTTTDAKHTLNNTNNWRHTTHSYKHNKRNQTPERAVMMGRSVARHTGGSICRQEQEREQERGVFTQRARSQGLIV